MLRCRSMQELDKDKMKGAVVLSFGASEWSCGFCRVQPYPFGPWAQTLDYQDTLLYGFLCLSIQVATDLKRATNDPK
ncbi:hypothetical protein KCU70_g95, partial [Aureobasidium melanogenum]